MSVRKLVEVHIIQNFAPSNLNRDDTGSPKDAIFGGYRRARISSQCLKRAIREFVRENHVGQGKLIPENVLSKRTRLWFEELANIFMEHTDSREKALQAAEAALVPLGLFVVKEGDPESERFRTEYLVPIGKGAVEHLIGLVIENLDKFVAAGAEISNLRDNNYAEPPKKSLKKQIVRTCKSVLGNDLFKRIQDSLLGQDKGLTPVEKAVDIALFGRMLADLPAKNVDAACQVAHAISTHRIEREFDFYTAVDDLNPAEETGAGMMGTVEFTSACFYRYAVVDLEKLVENLGGDVELALKGLEASLRASIYAVPSGKQNSFAAYNPPSFVAFVVRENASPRSLANAFERPVRAQGEKSLTQASVESLSLIHI